MANTKRAKSGGRQHSLLVQRLSIHVIRNNNGYLMQSENAIRRYQGTLLRLTKDWSILAVTPRGVTYWCNTPLNFKRTKLYQLC